jgi:hypothetical protein
MDNDIANALGVEPFQKQDQALVLGKIITV